MVILLTIIIIIIIKSENESSQAAVRKTNQSAKYISTITVILSENCERVIRSRNQESLSVCVRACVMSVGHK